MERQAKGVALVLAAAAIWGGSFVAIKVGIYEGLPPTTSLLLRFAVASVPSLAILRVLGPIRWAALKDPLVVGISAANAVGFVFQYLGLADTNSAVAAPLANIGVVVVAALSALYLHEKISARVAFAVMLAFVGGSLLATGGDPSSLGGTEFRAALLIAAASVIWSFFVVLNKVALTRGAHTETEITFAVIVHSAAITLPFAVAIDGVPTFAYGAAAWGTVLYTGLVCSSVAYVLYMMGMKRITATSTAVLTVFEVLVAFVLTALVFGVVLTGVAAVGAALVLGGIILASVTARGSRDDASAARAAAPPEGS